MKLKVEKSMGELWADKVQFDATSFAVVNDMISQRVPPLLSVRFRLRGNAISMIIEVELARKLSTINTCEIAKDL